ncbi:hypothetical protein [Saccharolobus islandicus]|nr:hypothetical protein [Sulfolobus islandicus]
MASPSPTEEASPINSAGNNSGATTAVAIAGNATSVTLPTVLAMFCPPA